MTLLTGVMLFFAALFWRLSSRYEWDIPHKGQIKIGSLKEYLCNNRQRLAFILEMESYTTNGIERRLWLLREALPLLQERYKLPLRIEVQIYSDLPSEQNNKYIECLQKRYSEIDLLKNSVKEMNQTINNTE